MPDTSSTPDTSGPSGPHNGSREDPTARALARIAGMTVTATSSAGRAAGGAADGPDGAGRAPALAKRNAPCLERAVLAHRGLPSAAPENTMAAFCAAADAGARWIETDIDLLADSTPVIIHDTALGRTTDRSGSIYGLRAADLENIDAGGWFGPGFAGQRIPTLDSFIDFMNERGINANIELKANEQGAARSIELVDALAAALERLDACRQVLVSSFSQPLLMAFHQRHPQYATAVLYKSATIRPDWRSVAELCGAVAIHPEDAGLTEAMVHAARAAGYGVNVWTVNRPDRANQLFNWGCTGVFSDVYPLLAAGPAR